ncbi:MAG: uroporphyrinogen-III C-methyltransferase [Nitritalea sp.]
MKNGNQVIKPQVTLLGAGPGDPELMTLKGILALNKADVVLYDALVDPSLLAHAPQTAIKRFVGKRAGQASSSRQEDIQALCVEMALAHGHVVRLKGGDPFVFGRGHEEWEYIQAAGIAVRYIPGISSAIAVPGLAGIPVTKRGESESFWVITATKSDASLSRDIALAVHSTATVVILMGMRKIDKIAAHYRAAGSPDLPAAVLISGSTACSQVHAGSIVELAAKFSDSSAREQAGPGIILIGEVAKHAAVQQAAALRFQSLLPQAV